MTIAIALIPVVALLILVLFYVTFASTRATQVAQCRADHDSFTKAVLEEDARLQGCDPFNPKLLCGICNWNTTERAVSSG